MHQLLQLNCFKINKLSHNNNSNNLMNFMTLKSVMYRDITLRFVAMASLMHDLLSLLNLFKIHKLHVVITKVGWLVVLGLTAL